MSFLDWIIVIESLQFSIFSLITNLYKIPYHFNIIEIPVQIIYFLLFYVVLSCLIIHQMHPKVVYNYLYAIQLIKEKIFQYVIKQFDLPFLSLLFWNIVELEELNSMREISFNN